MNGFGAFESVILTIITASTPLLLAAIGELVTERAGVLNLGVEGMMIMGAVCGFVVAYSSGSATLGVCGGLVAGIAMSLLFAFLTQTLMASQVATGLSLTLLGLGLSGMIGENFTGLPGGFRNGPYEYYDSHYENLGNQSRFWSYTENSNHSAWHRVLVYSTSLFSRSWIAKSYGFSVRCLKD